MTAASSPSLEVFDPSSESGEEGVAETSGDQPESSAQSDTPATDGEGNSPDEGPVDVVENTDALVNDVSEKSETFGAVLRALDELAIKTSSFSLSVLDALIFIAVLILVIGGAWVLTSFTRRFIDRFTRFDRAQTLLVEKILQILIWTAAFFIGIDLLGIDLTALAVFGGAFGLAIGFGLQKTFGNLIAGIILLLDKSIKPGDVIAVADTAGQETFGQIRKIGIRAVSVTTRDEREYLIPNENLMINQVENWSYSSKNVRMQVHVGVSYAADMKLAEELMLQAAKDAKRVLDTPPPIVWMTEYGDSSVNFTIHCWIRDPEEGVGNVRSEVLKNLWWLLKENDIEIPFPQRDLNLRDTGEIRDLIEALGVTKGGSTGT
ncbi:MAG: mechanosensitive ion channel domain-containing protein [Pseudomonadota bacterium]